MTDRRIEIVSFVLLLAAAWQSHAAIITERNDTNIFPPNYATFKGTPSRPGIDSCWIPYGTYTDRVGSTEYLRVTSNLTGVVCSAADGVLERYYAWQGLPSYERLLMYPTTDWVHVYGIENVDEFLAPYLLTNNTTRILDVLNNRNGYFYYLYEPPDSINLFSVRTWPYYQEPGMLELCLAYQQTYLDEQMHDGVAAYFGGRRLDDLVSPEGDLLEPPLSAEWTYGLPFNAADSNRWATVWPTYSALENDPVIFPSRGEEYRNRYYHNPLGYFMSLTYNHVWGRDLCDYDFPGRGWDLLDAVDAIPLACTMEDVLSADTGFVESDYKHWTNNTTRLDWKRLGLICQLERQMEITYRQIEHTDELPLWKMDTEHNLSFSEEFEVQVPRAEYNGQTVTLTNVFGSSGWSEENDSYENPVDSSQWSTPTCRIPVPMINGNVSGDGSSKYGIYIGEDQAMDLFMFLVRQVEQYTTNRIDYVEFVGNWIPNGMGLEFDVDHYSGEEIDYGITPTSYASVYEIHSGQYSYDSREGTVYGDWDLGPAVLNISEDTIAVSFDYGDSSTRYATDNIWGTEGNVDVPTLTFNAVGTGPQTNWMWRIYGHRSIPVEQCTKTRYTDRVRWDLSIPDGTAYVVYWFNEDRCEFYFSDPFLDFEHSGGGAPPRNMQSAWLLVNWYEDYHKDLDNSHTLSPYDGIPVESSEDSVPVYAYASLGKYTHPVFTWEAPGTREDAIRRWAEPNSEFLWGMRKSLRRSEMELLLWAADSTYAGDRSPSYIGPDADYNNGFNWENIKNEDAGRSFRYLRGASSSSRSSADAARYNMLANLSAACRNRCAQLGGMHIESIDTVGRITGTERERFLKSTGDAVATATFNITGNGEDEEGNGMMCIGGYSDDDDWTIAFLYYEPHESATPSYPFMIGEYGWEVEVTYSFPDFTNMYESVRADGFQAPMHRSLWKFKNLRDPDL